MRWLRHPAALLCLLAAGSATAQEVRNTASLSYAGPTAGTLLSNTVTLPVEAVQQTLPLPNPEPVRADLLLTMTASVPEATPGDRVTYRLALTNRDDGDATGIHLVVTLPPGLHGPDGGRTVDVTVGRIAAGATVSVPVTVTVGVEAEPGVATAQGVARMQGAVASNVASATIRIATAFFTDAITILGEVRSGPCGTPGRGAAGVRLLTENGTFAVTDADGRYHLEGIRPGRHVVQLDPASLGGAAALLCDDDTRAAGNAASRFVEATGGMIARADFRLAATPSPPAEDVRPVPDTAEPAERDWLRGRSPGIVLLYPGPDTNPRAPVTHVVVAHLPGQRVALTVGGRPVDPLAFDATDTDRARGVAVSRWSGIPLEPGANRIVATVLAADGARAGQVEGVVTLSGSAARATFDAAHSRLVADGVHPPLVAVRVVDGAGRAVRDGTVVRVTVAAPYALAGDVALDRARALAGQGRESSARVRGDDGIAVIALAPTAHGGEVQMSVAAAGDPAAHASDIHAWLDATAGQWVVVGFAAGTLGHDVIAGHRERADGAQAAIDGRAALYARGRIKGSWLLTIAYDSDRLRARDAAARGTIDPNRYYTVYGDASRQGEDASGGGTLYVRVEAHAFYALFGDVQTGFGDTQLLRYVRTVDGFQAGYAAGGVRASGFVARPSSRHVRDEIRGAGITGPYRLSARTLVPDSDTLTLEVRDRLRADIVVARTPLTRHVDYEIDATAGTVRMHQPLLSTDAARNPQFLVAEYESDTAAGATIAGVRVAVGRGPVGIGATALHDGGAGDADVIGLDMTARVDPATVLRAEAGVGGRGGLRAGHAWLAEIEHRGRTLDVTAYAREQQAGFGVGQQNGGETGTRKLGFDVRAALAARTSLIASAWSETKLDGSAARSLGTLKLERVRDHGTLSLGVEASRERSDQAPAREGARLTLGGNRVLAGGALVVAGEAQLGAGSGTAFPLRQRIDVTYRVERRLRLIAGYETSAAGGTARAGVDVTPWRGATLTGTLNRLSGAEDPARLYAVYGIAQNLALGHHWSLDATLDSSRSLGGGAVPLKPDPFGGGAGEDFVAGTLGAAYRGGPWAWTGRFEYRDAASATRIGLTTGVVRTLGAGRTLGANLRAYLSHAADGSIAREMVADLALALRPLGSRWSVLDRLEFRHQQGDVTAPADEPQGDDRTRVVNNLAVDYRSAPAGGGIGMSLYHGAKYGASGLIDMTGFALRRDLAAWLDIGVQAAVRHGWRDGTVSYSAGPSLGVSPARNVWISVGYNLAGFHDRDFTGGYTRRGAFLTLRAKFDQASLGLGRGAGT